MVSTPLGGVSLSYSEPSREEKKVDLKTSEGQHIDFTLKQGVDKAHSWSESILKVFLCPQEIPRPQAPSGN